VRLEYTIAEYDEDDTEVHREQGTDNNSGVSGYAAGPGLPV